MRQGMKVEIQNKLFYFLNSHLITNHHFLQGDLKTLPEGSMFQNFDLGSRYFLCYVGIFKIYLFSIYYVVWHKIKTRA